ncbi:hypothetical protein AB0J57_30395 [Streptomyces sp. NPDC049837]|uniref:hypothetical protein n=1 Tax=Streptomyces sp. NPDC049837 TaxID=3155277 RepID=UPI00342DE482
MRRREPPGTVPGLAAPHIPAEVYRQAEREGRPIVIVTTATGRPRRPARDYLMPIAVVFAGAIGVLGLIAAAMALYELALSLASGPIGLGITYKLARSSKH